MPDQKAPEAVKTELLRASDLTADHLRAWHEIQRAVPDLDSPFFTPDFTTAVAASGGSVEVVVLKHGGQPVGFFPFERFRKRVGRPVGHRVSDFNGFVVDTDVDWSPEELLVACELSIWHFDHLLVSQAPLLPHHLRVDDSPYIDLEGGFAAYSAERRGSGSSTLIQAARKRRKLEREVGPVRFDLQTGDPAALRGLVAWKRAQLAASGAFDTFRLDWVMRFIDRLLGSGSEHLECDLSALYAGDRIVAAHLGLRSGAVLASWAPAHDPDYGKYSPGLILHVALAERAAETGITRIDLGRGENQMKTSLMSGSTPVAIGFVDRSRVRRVLGRGWHRARDLAHATPLRGAPLRAYRRLRARATRG